MKYTLKDLMVGTKLRCTNDKDFSHWTTGKVYTVQYGTMNNYVECDDGTQISITGMLSRLNKENRYDAEFEIIKEEKQMKYTEKDIKEGTKLRCIDNLGYYWWTKGKIYTVVDKCIIDNDGDTFSSEYILNVLNDERDERNAKFEIVEEEEQMKYTQNDLKDGTKLRCTDTGNYDWWTEGRIYTVANKCILDNYDDTFSSEYILNCLNGQNIVEFEIFEYPTATITVDVEQRLNDKIEALGSERENILAKMDRMEKQQLKLRDKVLKLNEAKKALEILKELK